MNRRAFLSGAAALLAAPLAAEAQPTGKVTRVGVLWPGASPPRPPRLEAFREGLREAGYVEGKTSPLSYATPKAVSGSANSPPSWSD